MKNKLPSAPIVLKGAMVTGCRLWRSIIPATPALSKVRQRDVGYQNRPENKHHCGVCVQFSPSLNSCKLIQGPITLQGWCSLWAL